MTPDSPLDSFGAATPPETSVAAGWYPVDQFTQRYWDGELWTDHVAPLAPHPGTASLTASGLPPASSDDRTYVLIMHLGGLFVGFLVPLIMWLIKKNESPFIDHHGKQSMNFNLTMLIGVIISFVLLLVLIGFFTLLGLGVAYFVFSILAAVAGNRGEYYRFPLTIPFFK